MINRIYREVLTAEQRIRPHVRTTFVSHSAYLSDLSGGAVYLKLENLQITGSFKLRGALNKILSLSAKEADRGIVTASTGNHGLAMAHALKVAGRRGRIYLPRTAAEGKIRLLRRCGAQLEFEGEEPEETEKFARKVAAERGQVYVSPYNDPQVIGGQGTIGIEVLQQLGSVDAIFVAVGGGGLISGIGAYLKRLQGEVSLIGCLAENSPAMYESVRAGRIVETLCKPTLSDGTAGGIEKGSMTFALCRELVDDYVLVSEEEIEQGMRLMIEEHHQVVEGAAGVAVAAFLKRKRDFRNSTVLLLVCGGNVDVKTLRKVLG
ncbi:MAG: threonine/serine dehydratase [Acidobacteriota bacterium]